MSVTISHILYFFLLCLSGIMADNPAYCKFDDGKHCKKDTSDVDKGAHPVCECSQRKARKEVFTSLNDMKQFRENILRIHNKLRNDFAGGSEANKGFNYASDMMAMTYSTTLEDIARCRAMGSLFAKSGISHEPCNLMLGATKQKPKYYGQNLYGGTAKISSTQDLEKTVKLWYRECDDVDDKSSMDSFGSRGKMIGHFTQLVWSRATLLGCVLVHMPDSVIKTFQYALLCNYHGVIDIGASGNMMGQPVYKRVNSKEEICTACYAGTKCDPRSVFPNLCIGEVVQDSNPVKIIPGKDPSDDDPDKDPSDYDPGKDYLEYDIDCDRGYKGSKNAPKNPFDKSEGCTGNIARKTTICVMIFIIMVVFY